MTEFSQAGCQIN